MRQVGGRRFDPLDKRLAARACVVLAVIVVAGCSGGGSSNGGHGGGVAKAGSAVGQKANVTAAQRKLFGSWNIPTQYFPYLQSPALNKTKTTATCAAGSTKLTFWSWAPGVRRVVNLYNLTHPHVCIDWIDTSGIAGAPELAKLQATVKAGSGAPDLAHISRFDLASLALSHGVVDLAKYGAGSAKSEYPSYVWPEVTFGSNSVWGLPWDGGPMGILYNKAALKSYHLAIPTTWSQFADEAMALHRAHPGVYLADFTSLPEEELLWMQTQAFPVSWHGGRQLRMNYDTPPARAAANYWQKLWAAGALASESADALPKALSTSKVLSAWAPAWEPDVFTTPGRTAGQWTLAPMPQWKAGQNVQVNGSGSVVVVMAQSKQPSLAAAFDRWMMTSQPAWFEMVRKPLYLFPLSKKAANTPDFEQQTVPPLTGSQKIYKEFVDINNHNPAGWQWNPLESTVQAVMGDQMQKVLAHKTTLPDTLSAIQSALTQDAKNKGFTVTK